MGTGRAQSFNDVAVATVNAVRGHRGEKALSLEEMKREGAIEYIPFPPQLVGKYQSFTQADMSALRAAGPVRTDLRFLPDMDCLSGKFHLFAPTVSFASVSAPLRLLVSSRK